MGNPQYHTTGYLHRERGGWLCLGDEVIVIEAPFDQDFY